MSLTLSLHRNLQQFGERTATVDGDRSRSWAESIDRIGRFAAGLRSLGVDRGDRVAILSHNSDHFFEYLYAVWWVGAAVMPINTRWSAGEIAYAIEDSGTALLFVTEAFAAMLPEVRAKAPGLREIRSIGSDQHESWLACFEPIPDIRAATDDLAAILYTGGTTGFPKGVMLSHGNFLASALGSIAMPGCRATERYVHVPPLFHVGALGGLMIAMLCGSTQIFVQGFDPEGLMQTIAAKQVTDVFLVPTMIAMLLDHPAFGQHDLGSLKLIRYGASSIDDNLLDRAAAAFPGVGFVQAYGMTELSPVATVLTPADHEGEGRRLGKVRTAGRATPATEIRVVDPEGTAVAPGTVGEIIVRGPAVMMGYWGKPELTVEAIKAGWMHTGDLGVLDADGYVAVVDRLKDMIVTGGENVYSAEVENILADHPGVAAIAVIGLPDPKWGERVHAVVVRREGTLEASELQRHARSLIAGYKIPRSFEFVETLPLSAAGKVLKNVLRENALTSPEERESWD